MKTIIKQPSEAVFEPMTFGGISTISTLVSVTAISRGLVTGSAALTVAGNLFANALTIEISGGTDGERYLVTAIADDAEGQRREEEFEVAVLDLTWTMPDGGAPMLSIAEFVARFGIEEVVRMTDERGDGRIGRERLIGALTDAQADAEAHIVERYALPLAEVPVLIKSAIADIARGRLYPGTAPDGVASLAKAALRKLENIKDGRLSLPGAASASATASEAPILFHSGGRTYPDGLKEFGL